LVLRNRLQLVELDKLVVDSKSYTSGREMSSDESMDHEIWKVGPGETEVAVRDAGRAAIGWLAISPFVLGDNTTLPGMIRCGNKAKHWVTHKKKVMPMSFIL
jgi:hypothetical protein